MLREERYQIAARIAQRLREAGHDIVIINPAHTAAAVLWRDRVVISLALILLTALALTSLAWLAAEIEWATRCGRPRELMALHVCSQYPLLSRQLSEHKRT